MGEGGELAGNSTQSPVGPKGEYARCIQRNGLLVGMDRMGDRPIFRNNEKVLESH